MPFGYEGWAHEGREPAKIGSVTLFANLIEHYGLAKFSDEERNILLVNKKALQARMEQLLPRSAAAAAPATSDTFVHRPRPAPCGRPIPRPDGIMIPHQGRDRKCAVWSTQAGLCIKTGCASSCPKVQDSWSRAALLVTNPWAACAAQHKQIISDLRSCRDDPPYDPRDVPRTFSRCSRAFSSRTWRAGTKPLGTGSWRRRTSNLWRRVVSGNVFGSRLRRAVVWLSKACSQAAVQEEIDFEPFFDAGAAAAAAADSDATLPDVHGQGGDWSDCGICGRMPAEPT